MSTPRSRDALASGQVLRAAWRSRLGGVCRTGLAVVGLMLGLTAVVAQAANDDDAAQRQRIARERSEVEARARSAQAECARRFAVTACMTEVRKERRAAVQQLDHQTALLDDAQRKQRAAERQERLRQRQEVEAKAAERAAEKAPPAAAAKPRDRADEAPGADAARAGDDGAAAVSQAPPRKSKSSPQSMAQSKAQAKAKAAQRAAASQARTRDAAQHREAVERRNVERAAKKKQSPSLPLPLPPALPASAVQR